MDAERGLHVLMTADCVGGVWEHALELSAALQAVGVRTSLATMGAALTDCQLAQAAAQPALGLYQSRWRLEWMEDPWDDVRQAGEWLLGLEDSLRPDLVHLNQFAFGALAFAAPKLVVGHSCVLSWFQAVHRAPAPSCWRAYRQAVHAGLEGADRVAAPSRWMLDALAAHHGGGWRRRGLVLPNGRSQAAFAPAPKQPFILSAGRLWDAAKNLQALVAVAPALPWPVCVAGALRAPGADALRAPGADADSLAVAGDAAGAVQWLGPLGSPELASRMAAAAIYVHPARYEPFGQAVLEAGLAGCALVLGDIASLREVWGRAALFVPPDDHAALKDALGRLIAEPALRRTMAGRALRRARRFSPRRMAEAYLDAYRRLREPAPVPRRTPDRREAACAS